MPEQMTKQIKTDKMSTPEFCLAAVTKDGNSIQYLTKEQKTPVVCLAAVTQDGNTVQTPKVVGFKVILPSVGCVKIKCKG